MAALVSNFVQAAPLDVGDLTAAIVAGADAAIFNVGGGFNAGIDNITNPCRMYNDSNDTVGGSFYSAHATFGASRYDVSGADQGLALHFKWSNSGTTGIAKNADSLKIVLFSDGGLTNYGIWEFDPSDMLDQNYYPILLTGTPDSTDGTFDDANVSGIGFLVEALAGGWFSFDAHFDQLVYIDGPVIFDDTGTAAQLGIDDYYDLLKPTSGETFHSLMASLSGPVFEAGYPVEIRADDLSYTYPSAGLVSFKSSGIEGFSKVGAGYYQYRLVGQAGGSQVINNLTVVNNVDSFTFLVDGSAATTNITLTNVTFAGASTGEITGVGNTVDGFVTSSGAVEIADGDLTLTMDTGTAAINWSGDMVAGSTITTASDLDITFAETDLSDINLVFTGSNTITVSPTTGSGTYDLSGATSTGTVTFDNATANDTTITIPAGLTHAVEDPTTGGGAIVIDNAVIVAVEVNVKDTSLAAISAAAIYLEAATGGPLPYRETVSITRAGTVATVTHTAHGLLTGDEVKVRGCDQSAYNISASITVTGVNTYTYSVTGTPATQATGTPTATSVILNGDTNGSGILQDASFTYTADQPVSGTARKATSAPFYRASPIVGTITVNGFTSSVILVGDE